MRFAAAREQRTRRMSQALIIAEKPSVAQDIVRALTPIAGKFDKHDEYFESDGYIVTSAVGHLLEIKAPEEFDVKRGKWSFAHLPVIPPHFDLAPLDKTKSAAERDRQAGQAQGRQRADQRLRRRPRGRADLSPDPAARQVEASGQAPLAAEHDAGGDPRRLRAPAQRQADAAAGRRRALPLRGRLAGRHQRHAGDDRVQLARRRLLPDHRRPGADADAVDHGRARGADPEARLARLLGGARDLRGHGRRVRGQVVRPGVEEEPRRRRAARRPPLERGRRAGDRRRGAGRAGQRHRGGQAEHARRRRSCTT